jgi:hypothetical protein
MPTIAYTVTATVPDETTAGEYAAWLTGGHTAQVIAAGASAAAVVRITDPPLPIRIEARYLFPSDEAYAAYIERSAPALRAQGLERFPPARGIGFDRRTGRLL